SVTVTAPQGGRPQKQACLEDLIALRDSLASGTVKKLDEAIYKLKKSLDPALWLNDSHLDPKKGNKVFDNEKDGVHKLEDLLTDEKNTIPADTLLGFIHCFTSVDRQLAVTAIDDAVANGGKAEKIAKAREELAKGDDAAADG